LSRETLSDFAGAKYQAGVALNRLPSAQFKGATILGKDHIRGRDASRPAAVSMRC